MALSVSLITIRKSMAGWFIFKMILIDFVGRFLRDVEKRDMLKDFGSSIEDW